MKTLVSVKDARLIPIILKAFGGETEVAFSVLVARLGRSRKTSFYWLKRMENIRVVDGSFVPAGRGRPRLVYRLNYQTRNQEARETLECTKVRNASSTQDDNVMAFSLEGRYRASGEAIVVLPFRLLREVCRSRLADHCGFEGSTRKCTWSQCRLFELAVLDCK